MFLPRMNKHSYLNEWIRIWTWCKNICELLTWEGTRWYPVFIDRSYPVICSIKTLSFLCFYAKFYNALYWKYWFVGLFRVFTNLVHILTAIRMIQSIKINLNVGGNIAVYCWDSHAQMVLTPLNFSIIFFIFMSQHSKPCMNFNALLCECCCVSLVCVQMWYRAPVLYICVCVCHCICMYVHRNTRGECFGCSLTISR